MHKGHQGVFSFFLKCHCNHRPVRIEYTLTEKGEALHPVLDEMASYSTEFCAKDVFKDRKARKLEDVFGNDLSRQ
jgi:DNA-binding HxlR family transcriptional regulator